VPRNYQGNVGAVQFCFEKDQPEWIFDLRSESFLQLQPKSDVVLSLDLVLHDYLNFYLVRDKVGFSPGLGCQSCLSCFFSFLRFDSSPKNFFLSWVVIHHPRKRERKKERKIDNRGEERRKMQESPQTYRLFCRLAVETLISMCAIVLGSHLESAEGCLTEIGYSELYHES